MYVWKTQKVTLNDHINYSRYSHAGILMPRFPLPRFTRPLTFIHRCSQYYGLMYSLMLMLTKTQVIRSVYRIHLTLR